MRRCLQWLSLVILALVASPEARAQTDITCHPGTSDGLVMQLPPALTDKARALFGLTHMSAQQVRRSTVVRCMGGRLLACNYGANIPCGKADTRRSLPAAANEWCGQHPNATFIPAYITSHATVWHWRCRQGQPTTTGAAAAVDEQGFLSDYWKRVA